MMHEDLTQSIIGCAMKVHRYFGNGFQELIYQRALEIEFKLADITHKREKEMEIMYHDVQIGTRRVDFLVENLVMVELKALSQLEDAHLAQAKNYLEVYHLRIGLLINFGAPSLQFKRILNTKGPHNEV